MLYVAHADEGPLSPSELPDEAEQAEEAQGAQEAMEAEELQDAVKVHHEGTPMANSGASPRQQAAVVRGTVPLVGSSGSSKEGPAVARKGRQRIHELQARIRACQREQQRLEVEYDVEVQHCADLRDALEAREKELTNAREPLQVQLQQAHEALELADRMECEALMHIEDDLAHCARLLESKDRDVRDLERRLNDTQQGYHKFLRDGPPKDTVVEEALRAADKEMKQLLSGVQLREQVIAHLNADLRSALEYMIATNVEAAGGLSPDLGLEDFLPSSMREHLGLSEHGSTHLAILYKKCELIMAEQQQRGSPSGAKFHDGNANHLSDQSTCTSSKETGAAAHQNAWHISDIDSSRRSSQLGEYASELTSQSGQYTPLEAGLEEVMPPSPAPTLAAGLLPVTMTMPSPSEAFARMMPAFSDMWAHQKDLENSQVPVSPLEVAGDDDGVWDLAAEEAWPSSGSRAAAGEALSASGRPSASLEEESRVLREAMAQELGQLAEALVPPASSGASGGTAAAARAGRELRRAAAQGDEKAVRHWLPQATSAPAGDADAADAGFLGWTAWHVAAAYGQCGVLECLKEDLCHRATHHLSALDCRTPLGLPPLGTACLAGRVEAARSLLLGMAPVDVRDTRGNTPLLWAVIGGQARALVPLLLDVRADAEAANCSGQRPDIAGLLGGWSMTTLTWPATGTAMAVGPAGAAAENSAGASTRQDLPPERFREAYHLIRTIGAEPPEEPSLLSYTLGMLKAPVRDAIGFGRNAKAKQLAQLSAAEAEMGVWSEWVSNYTHAGLHAAVEVGRQNADPLLRHRNRQALVLTTERLLLFNAGNWSLVQVITLSELAELTVSSFSSSALILCMHQLPDVVLDIAVSARGRLIDELQLAVGTMAAKWGGADFDGLRIRHDSEPVVELFDERRKRAGTLAYIEAHVFLLLPYAPNSLLLLGGDAFFFGLLDVHRSSTAVRGSLAGSVGPGWKWQTCFFILKSAPGEGRKLLWCRHPNDEQCLGSVHIGRLLAVQPLDTPQGEACLIMEYRADGRAQALTLRASSAQNREDWIVSLRTMQTGL